MSYMLNKPANRIVVIVGDKSAPLNGWLVAGSLERWYYERAITVTELKL